MLRKQFADNWWISIFSQTGQSEEQFTICKEDQIHNFILNELAFEINS